MYTVMYWMGLIFVDFAAVRCFRLYRDASSAAPLGARIAVGMAYVALRGAMWAATRPRREPAPLPRPIGFDGSDRSAYGTMAPSLRVLHTDPTSRIAALSMDVALCVLNPMLAGPGRFKWPGRPGVPQVVATHVLPLGYKLLGPPRITFSPAGDIVVAVENYVHPVGTPRRVYACALGRHVVLTDGRGEFYRSGDCSHLISTWWDMDLDVSNAAWMRRDTVLYWNHGTDQRLVVQSSATDGHGTYAVAAAASAPRALGSDKPRCGDMVYVYSQHKATAFAAEYAHRTVMFDPRGDLIVLSDAPRFGGRRWTLDVVRMSDGPADAARK
jgi:hypothetical protein